MRLNTKLIHGTFKHISEDIDNVIEPIYLCAVYRFDRVEHKEKPHVIPYKYGREDNPTVYYLEVKLKDIEEGVDALAFSSGMAAINTLIQSLITKGTIILIPLDVYGSTLTLFKNYEKYGVKVEICEPGLNNVIERFYKVIKNNQGNTIIIFIESLSNPMLRFYNIEELNKVIQEAKHRKDNLTIYLIVDNTLLTPIGLRPLKFSNVNFVVYSATKYLSGHNDVVGGFIIGKNPELMKNLWNYRRLFGTIMDPFTAYLIDRGLKTLHVRMRVHEENAKIIAEFLLEHPKVVEVIYPSLENYEYSKEIRKLVSNFSGIVSFKVKGGLDEALTVYRSTKIIIPGVSFGGTESIITHPTTTTHSYWSSEERLKAGITDNLLRLSVGLEDVNDLIEDLDNALRKVP